MRLFTAAWLASFPSGAHPQEPCCKVLQLPWASPTSASTGAGILHYFCSLLQTQPCRAQFDTGSQDLQGTIAVTFQNITRVIFTRRFSCKAGGKATGNQQNHFCCLPRNMNLWYHRGQMLVNAGLNPVLRAIGWYWQVIQVDWRSRWKTSLTLPSSTPAEKHLFLQIGYKISEPTHYSYEMTGINKAIALAG